MPFCTNPECPQFKKTGKSSEFVDGTAVCSDCGGQLSDTGLDAAKAEKPATDLKKRLIYTLFMLALWRVLSHIPTPWVNMEALSNYLGYNSGNMIARLFGFSQISVFSLGLMPYITAYVGVEIFALFLKPLKSWRESGYTGRLKLRRTAFFATLVLALIQGYGIAQGLSGMNEEGLITNRGVGYSLLIALTMTTGTFITLWIADQITRKGIGHGISVLICASSAGSILFHLLRLFDKNHQEFLPRSPFEYLFFAALLSLGVIALITFMEKGSKKIKVKYTDGMESYIPFKFTTAGIIPASWASSLLMLPFTIMGFMQTEYYQKMVQWLAQGTLGYYIICTPLIILLYYFFSAIFYNPKKMVASLQYKNGSMEVPEGKSVEDHIDRILGMMAFPSAIYLSLIYFLPYILIKAGFPIFLGGIVFIKTVAIILDLSAEFRLRKKAGQLVKIVEFRDVQKAGLLKDILEQKSIPCVLQGYYYRSLLYFFGPYIEISVLVPKEKSDEALELVELYIP